MARIVLTEPVSGLEDGSRGMAAEYLLVDYQGRRPPESGMDEWGVTWAPLPEHGEDFGRPALTRHEDEIARSYPVGRLASTARELAALPFPDGRDPAPFAGLLERTVQLSEPIGLAGDERPLPLRRPHPNPLPEGEGTSLLPSPSGRGAGGEGGAGGVGLRAAGRHALGPLDRLCALLGPERALVALIEEPGATRAALERIADYHVAIARNYLTAGCAAGWLADEYAGAGGPLLNPGLWRELVLPGLRRIIGVYKDAGACVFFHMCGRAEAFVPDLRAAGVDAFNLEKELNRTLEGMREVVCRN